MKSTKQNLKRISRAYDRNFALLVKYVDTPKHAQYVRRERKLNYMSIKMRKRLGIYVNTPCRLHNQSKLCRDCSGWYKSVKTGKTLSGDVKHKFVMAKEDEGMFCFLKEI